MANKTFVKVVSGDPIPGLMVSAKCERCKKAIVRKRVTDSWDPSKGDLKVVGCMQKHDETITVTWTHLCKPCADDFVKMFDRFKKNIRKKKKEAR